MGSTGTPTWTITGTGATVWDCASAAGNLTINSNTATIIFTAAITANRTIALGTSKTTYNNITIVDTGTNAGGFYTDVSIGTAVTIANLTITAPITARFGNGTYTVTSLNSAGTSSQQSSFLPASGATPTIAITSASLSFTGFYGMTFTGSPTANNSFNFGHNTGITINGPSVGGGSHCIGC